MKRFFLMAVLVVGIVAMTGWSASAQLASSTFDTDAEGWGIFNDANNFEWNPFGNPAGSIHAHDVGAGLWWFFVAPDKFLGDKGSAYGGSLSFDLWPSPVDNADTDAIPDVYLEGAGLQLAMDFDQPLAQTWNLFSVNLLESSGWKIIGGGAPTADQMKSVLGDIDVLRIRGEFRSGADYAYLDNVILNAGEQGDQEEPGPVVPEPGAMVTLATGLAGFAMAYRRRKSS